MKRGKLKENLYICGTNIKDKPIYGDKRKVNRTL